MWSVASRIARMSLVVGLGVIALDGCTTDDTLEGVAATGTAFTQALFSDYSALSKQAAALAAPEVTEEPGFFESLFDDAGDTGPNAQLANAFTAKALVAAPGNEPEPEAAPDQMAAALRARLVRLLAIHKDDAPVQAAQAQADFDCWIIYGAVPGAAGASQACRTSLDTSLAALESVGRNSAARHQLRPRRDLLHPHRQPRGTPPLQRLFLPQRRFRSISTSIPGPSRPSSCRR